MQLHFSKENKKIKHILYTNRINLEINDKMKIKQCDIRGLFKLGVIELRSEGQVKDRHVTF